MDIIKKLLARQAFGLAILLSSACACLWPSAFLQWGGVKVVSLVVPCLQLIMFGMGTTLGPGDFLQIIKEPWKVLLGSALQFLVMPLLGFAIAKILGFQGELAAGIVLVGSVSGGTASNLVSYLARANVALSVTMTCISTLLSPLVTPLIFRFLAGQYIEVNAPAMMLEMLKIVILPVALGLAVHCLLKGLFERHKKAAGSVLSTVSMAGVCLVLVAIIAPAHEKMKEAGALLFLAAVIHNTLGYAIGYWASRLAGLFFKVSETDARTIAIEVGMQNSGLASALGLSILHSPLAALPGTVFSIWMNFSGSLLAGYWGKRQINTN